MTNETVAKIKKAEQSAAEIINEARISADKLTQKAKKESELSKKRTEAALCEKRDKRLSDAKKDADRIISAALENGRKCCLQYERTAHANWEKAKKAVIREILEKWQ